MSRPIKNLEQIRSLLGRMDRLIEDARSKREGGPASIPVSVPAPAPIAQPAANPHLGTRHTPQPPLQAHRPPQPTKPLAPMPPSSSSNSSSAGHSNGHAASPSQPQRIKAKPKRAGSSDPLQDFQQRQAS